MQTRATILDLLCGRNQRIQADPACYPLLGDSEKWHNGGQPAQVRMHLWQESHDTRISM